jgi:hypothetical protein
MSPADFKRIALSLDGAEQGSHMGAIDFRVGGRIFATLAHQAMGYGNLMLTPEQQAAFVEELPDVFLPVAGGWGRMGATHVVLANAHEDVVRGALETAWRLRTEMNQRTKRPSRKTAASGKKVSRSGKGTASRKASASSRPARSRTRKAR